jgi:hypothetical protein
MMKIMRKNTHAGVVSVTLLLAVASCSGTSTSPSACRAAHPRGADPVASADVVAQTIMECGADTGECQATPPCESLLGRVCDASRFMTADAAICIAQAAGLEPGLRPAGAGLVYDARARRVAWSVSNLLYDPAHPAPADGGGGDSGGQYFQIDAVSGVVLLEGAWGEVQ